MKSIICLAVFLAASLSSGEALQCRMCKSSNESDYCTAKPLLVGTHECGKYESDIRNTLSEIESIFKDKIILEDKLKNLDDLMITLETKKASIDEYYVTMSNDTKPGTVKEEINKMKNAYTTYVKSFRQFQYAKTENESITAFIAFGDAIQLNSMLKDVVPAESEIQKIQEIFTNNSYNATTNYNDFQPIFKSIRDKLNAEGNITAITTLVLHNKTVLAEIAKIPNNINITYSDMEVLKNTAEKISTQTVEKLKQAVKNQNPDEAESTKQQQFITDRKKTLDALFGYVTLVKIFGTSLHTLSKSFQPLKTFVTNELTKISEQLLNDTESLKSATNKAREVFPTNKDSLEWMCFKEIKEKLVTRGCTVKTNATDELNKLYTCHEEDGCNSSTIISIGVMPIFIAITVAFGFFH